MYLTQIFGCWAMRDPTKINSLAESSDFLPKLKFHLRKVEHFWHLYSEITKRCTNVRTIREN